MVWRRAVHREHNAACDDEEDAALTRCALGGCLSSTPRSSVDRARSRRQSSGLYIFLSGHTLAGTCATQNSCRRSSPGLGRRTRRRTKSGRSRRCGRSGCVARPAPRQARAPGGRWARARPVMRARSNPTTVAPRLRAGGSPACRGARDSERGARGAAGGRRGGPREAEAAPGAGG